MRKFILSIFLGLIFTFISIGNINAADLNVDCPTLPGTCSKSGLDPLFSNSLDGIWYPGKSITRTINLKNSGVDSKTMSLAATRTSVADSILENAMLVTITPSAGGSPVYSGNLTNLYSLTNIDFGTFAAGANQDFNFTVMMNPSSGNETQNRETIFDLTLGFWQVPTPTPTSVPSSGGGGGSVAGASTVCNSTAPTSAPFLTSSVAGTNSINLSWTSVSPVTHYMIRYGTSPGNYIYGASNVGNVNSFVVNLLSGGTTYYFQVAGVNNCMPGPWSNEVGRTPGGVLLPPGPAEGFTEEILGVESEASPSPTPDSTSTPVLGAEDQTCQDKYYPWWVPLVIQALASFVYLGWRWKDKRWWALIGLFGIISQIIHWILKCNCATGELCPWYWIFNLIIVAFAVLYQEYQKRNHKKKVDSA